MTWEEYCISKKIDSKAFKENDPLKWDELKNIFEQVHPNSFTEQKKFLINNLRRRYLLVEGGSAKKAEETPVKKVALPFLKKKE
jgi:DNA recombination-dependent growth factor C